MNEAQRGREEREPRVGTTCWNNMCWKKNQLLRYEAGGSLVLEMIVLEKIGEPLENGSPF